MGKRAFQDSDFRTGNPSGCIQNSGVELGPHEKARPLPAMSVESMACKPRLMTRLMGKISLMMSLGGLSVLAETGLVETSHHQPSARSSKMGTRQRRRICSGCLSNRFFSPWALCQDVLSSLVIIVRGVLRAFSTFHSARHKPPCHVSHDASSSKSSSSVSSYVRTAPSLHHTVPTAACHQLHPDKSAKSRRLLHPRLPMKSLPSCKPGGHNFCRYASGSIQPSAAMPTNGQGGIRILSGLFAEATAARAGRTVHSLKGHAMGVVPIPKYP